MSAREIDQNAPQQLGQDGEEARPVLPRRLTRITQPQVCLIDQRSRLQRMPGTFLTHVMPGQAA